MTKPGALRIATYNLLHGAHAASGVVDLPKVAAALETVDADVIAVQEVDRCLPRSGFVHQIDELAALLGCVGAFAPAVLGGSSRVRRTRSTRTRTIDAGPDGPAYGVGFLARIPISSTATLELPGPRDPRIALRIVVPTPWGRVSITTAHLSMWPWRSYPQLVALSRFARGDSSVSPGSVLVADLNLPPGPVRTVLGSRGWRVATGGPTFPAWKPVTRLDHIAVRGPVLLRDVQTGVIGPGDHLPVSATLLSPCQYFSGGGGLVVDANPVDLYL